MPMRPFRFATLLACVLLAGCATANADLPASTVTKALATTQDVPAGTTVKVENLLGRISVRQGGSQLKVTATVVAGGDDHAAAQRLADTIRLDVSHDGDTLLVHVHYPVDAHDTYRYIPTKGSATQNSHQGGVHVLGMTIGHSYSASTGIKYQGHRVSIYEGRDRGVPLHVDLVINLPAGSHADVHNHVGLMDAANLDATLALHSDSGDVQAKHVSGKLTVHADSGDTTIADARGQLAVDSDSGDVHITTATGTVTVNADSGDVIAKTLHGGSVTVHADSGDIHLDDASGPLRLSADSGDIWLKNLGAVPHLKANADSGDIRASGNLSGVQSFRLETDSGDVTLSTANPPAVRLDIHADDIRVDWSGLSAVERSDNRYRANVGSAAGQGSIHTDNGDVALTR